MVLFGVYPYILYLYKHILCLSQSIDRVVIPSAKNAWGTHLGSLYRRFSDQG